MATKQACLEQVTIEVEDFAGKVASLKERLARANGQEKLRHSWEIYVLRERFEDFRQHVLKLEEADEEHLEEIRQSTDSAWSDLNGMIEAFLNEIC